MRQRNLYLFVILCWLCTYGSPVQAQDDALHAAEEAISNYNYQQAIDLIGRLDSLSPDLQRKKLAAYKELNRYGEAIRLLDDMPCICWAIATGKRNNRIPPSICTNWH